MVGIGKLREFAREAIGTHRRSRAVRALHGFTSFVEAAYANEGSSFQANGEEVVLRRLQAANFQVALDVGANRGDWSSDALAVWPNCHVHAFEVAPPTFQRLSESMCASGYRDRITLNCCGLSDDHGTRQMYYFPDHPEVTCDMPRHRHVTEPFDAQLTTGDRYCDAQGIDTVDFLKIDVEGAEFRVMNGFSQRIAARKIHCMQFEYGAFSAQTKFHLCDYYSLLSPSYWLGKIFANYVEFRDYHWTMEDLRFSNYVCVSRLRPDLRELLAA